MVELLASIWAFRTAYFKSKFHIFDATIIVVSFIFEVSLQGVEEEVASLIVVLRLLRVVKIVDELSVGAEAHMSDLEQRLESIEKENRELREVLRARRSAVQA
ncbi:uncharacterized protein N0V89_002224 [Didymosphaeria variabile]|uniref:Voltage-gated hydrogen channel 1 n=1 Tax=Didymosphaeria variabile TaxID=1932322 RepID=A0A9W8XTQ4_9PLEO|nr:uncharacterized protein N0V89_002224 [Didymosphaeria variabile]KAJ4357648.1 hypothetical protein N0V89_002224 [Didymosphaeria variabile]